MTGMELFVIATVLGAVTGAAGTVIASKGEQAQAEQAAEVKKAEAIFTDRRAAEERANKGQVLAASQRAAITRRRESERLMSDQTAKLAAGRGGLYGSGSIILGATAAAGEYNAEMELWQGHEEARAIEARARGADRQAAMNRMEGESYSAASRTIGKTLPFKVGSQILGATADIGKATAMPSGSGGGGGGGSSFTYG